MVTSLTARDPPSDFLLPFSGVFARHPFTSGECRQLAVVGPSILSGSSPSPAPMPSWLIQEVKTSAPAKASSNRNQDRCHLMNGNIFD
jgi:hypothetical protein